ncbi:MAG TPA: high frequency lysogenization protein HflD [Gammaproteobacteria bacterium]|jgi:high frequency lysogenization protein|nr:high frequency lysogenization protein HflD [Gammaproteobacteria bacterium]
MTHTLTDRTMALAALFQAAQLVQHVARRGHAADSDVETCINSLFQIDAPSTEAIFNGSQGLATGLRTLRARLRSGGSAEELEITRYVIVMLHLERKLAGYATMQDTLRIGIERIRNQLNYFPSTHENILAALGELYQATISTLRPRIMVQGEPTYLADKARANQIRALLLAGIRAAVLWRQLGGRRWQLFISRRKILETAQRLLEQPTSSDAP